MKVGLLLNSNNRLCSYSEKYKDLLEKNKIAFDLIDPNSATLFDDIKECSHLLFRHTQGDTDKLVYEAIFHLAQNIYKVKCWPNFETYWPYEDKIKEYYLLKSYDFPIIKSNIFWNYEPAENFLKSVQLPVVAKLPKGAGSSNVVIVKSVSDGQKIIRQVFGKGVKTYRLKSSSNLSSFKRSGLKSYGKSVLKTLLINLNLWKDKADYPEWQIQKDAIMFQEFLPGNQFDTRVTIIGNRAFAYRRFVRENDFRASGSGKFSPEPEKIDLRCLQIAFSISKKLNFDTMAYDFIYDKNHTPYINEISYCFVDFMVESCPGFWDEDLVWHAEKTSPQYFQLKDFLEMDNLEKM